MKLPQAKPLNKAENTVSLINIVFLMLIFFLLAGTLATPPDPSLEIPETTNLTEPGPAPIKAVSVSREGLISIDGRKITHSALPGVLQNLSETRKSHPLKLIADRRLEARTLIGIISELKAGGFEKITVITVRGRS